MKKFTSIILVAIAASHFGVAQAVELLNFKAEKAGMYRVTHEQLVAAGADLTGVRVRSMALTSGGEYRPISVRGSDQRRGRFGSGGFIEFYAEGIDSLYTTQQVFTLHSLNWRERRSRKSIEQIDNPRASRQIPFVQEFTQTKVIDENNYYAANAPSATDPYSFGIAFSLQAVPVYDFELEGVVGGSGAAKIEAEFFGLLDFPVEGNDHQYQLKINGVDAGAPRGFDGESADTNQASGVQVQEGGNTVTFEYIPVDGVPYDLISLNTLTVHYPRVATANEDGVIAGTFAGQQAMVSGFESRPNVYRIDAPDRVYRLRRVQKYQGNRVFTIPGGTGNFMVVDPSSYLQPEVAPIVDANGIDAGQAEYLVIAHKSLMGSELDRLVALRSADMSVKVVDVEQVYAKFGNHTFGAEGIEAYIKYAAANMGTKYVVLIGNDTYDYKQIESQSVSLIPTKYVPTKADLLIWQTPSDAVYGDLNADGIPDLAVGRIPARTKEELGNAVTKIEQYQGSRTDYVGRMVLATDKNDLGNNVNFTRDASDLINVMPDIWGAALKHREDFTAYPDRDGHQSARDKLIARINDGVLMTTYLGHSSRNSWAYTRPAMLQTADIAGLTNVGKPTIVTQYGCWNTYFVDPRGNTMGNQFLTGGLNGAATVLGASTLTTSSGEVALGLELYQRMLDPGVRIGDAIIAAKQALAEKADYSAIQLGWQILGDPAIVVSE